MVTQRIRAKEMLSVSRRARFGVFTAILVGTLAAGSNLCAFQDPAAAVSPPANDDAKWNSKGFSVPFDQKSVDRSAQLDELFTKGDWSKAFRLLADTSDDAWKGMLPDGQGFVIPARRKLADRLLTLPPEGRDAFRVFFESTARTLMETIQKKPSAPGADEKAAEQLFNRYFLTSYGDDAADILGDAHFQRGDYLQAERYWRAILEAHPDTSLSEAKLMVKCGISLVRAQQPDRFKVLRDSLALRFPNEKVKIGGQEVEALKYLDELAAKSNLLAPVAVPKEKPAPESGPVVAPPENAEILWRASFVPEVKISDDANKSGQTRVTVRAGNGAVMTMQSGSGLPSLLSRFCPTWVADDRMIYCNWLGACRAVDRKTGKEAWRSEDFATVGARFGMNGNDISYRATLLAERPFSLAAADGVIVASEESSNQTGPDNTIVMRDGLRVHDAETGKLLWRSSQLDSLKNIGFTGNPVIRGDSLYVVAGDGEKADLLLRSHHLKTGRTNWTLPLGTPQAGGGDDWTGMAILPTPAVLLHENKLFVLTNNGALLCADVIERSIDWVYKYEMAMTTGINRRRFGWDGNETSDSSAPASLLLRDGILYFKESKSGTLTAMDIVARRILWSRPVTANSRISGIDNQCIYLRGTDLMAIDRNTRALRWSIRLPQSTSGEIVIGPDRILVPTARGIYELSIDTGDNQRIFRKGELGALNGSLALLDGNILCISSYAITAFARTPEKPKAEAQPEEKPKVEPAGKSD